MSLLAHLREPLGIVGMHLVRCLVQLVAYVLGYFVRRSEIPARDSLRKVRAFFRRCFLRRCDGFGTLCCDGTTQSIRTRPDCSKASDTPVTTAAFSAA